MSSDLRGDRRFQVVNDQGLPFTQRTHGIMAHVSVRYEGDLLKISASRIGEIEIPLTVPTPSAVATEVWSSKDLVADHCGEAAQEFFSQLLGESARLVRVGQKFSRAVKNHPNERAGFADAFPLLGISEASLADLNRRLQKIEVEPATMEQFRPNLVFTGCKAFAEDDWNQITIGNIRFAAGGPCERCIMTTLNPATGAKLGPEPLRTLARYRRDPEGTGVWFGQNLVNLSKSGTVGLNDAVTPS